MDQPAKPGASGLQVFTLIWFGQLVSMLGSGLTTFALGVWVYQQTGSVTQVSLVILCDLVPIMLISPVAGILADRWDRRKLMILGDTGAALSTLSIAVLAGTGHLAVWHICLAIALLAACGALQGPAFGATLSLLVPKEAYGRASGMFQFSQAATGIAAPLLAGFLIVWIQLQGVIAIDFATFLFSTAILLLVRFPQPPVSEAGQVAGGSFWQEATYGWNYIASYPGLVGLVLLSTTTNFFSGFTNILFTPLVLSFSTPESLGFILSASGAGMLVGSLVLSAWGGPKRRIYGLLGSTLVRGTFLILIGIFANVPMIALITFGGALAAPFAMGCNQVIWQRKVPADVQGRVFATLQMTTMSAMSLAVLLAGPLADKVFEPLLVVGGPLAGSVGQIIGVGAGRGIGLIFILLGVLTALSAAVSYLYPRLRLVESELPDAVLPSTLSPSTSDSLTTSEAEESLAPIS